MTRLSSAGLAVLVLCSLAGCANAQVDQDDADVLRVGAASPSTTMNYLRTSLTRDYLVSNGTDGRAIPRLLDSWSASEDGLTWRLRLRAGVRFHDGSELTSEDLVPSLEQLEKSVFAATKLASVRALDKLTIEVRLAERSSFFLEDLAGVFAEKRAAGRSVGTGPFLVESESEQTASLRAFGDYYRGAPAIERVEISTYADLRNAWTALMRSQIDLLYELNRQAREFVEAESTVQVSTFIRPYVMVLGFNPSRPQFRSPSVRQAFALAIDRNRLVQEALHGRGEAASSFIWPRNWAFDAAVAPVTFNPSEAVRRLDQAGFRVGKAGAGMPSRLAFKVMVYAPLERMALALQRQLAHLDIDMQIETPSNEDLVKRMASGDFDAFLFEMSGGPSLKWSYLFWHSQGGLRRSFGIDYSATDVALDNLRLATNDREIRAAVREFQLALASDPPAVFLAWGEIARASSRRFEIPKDGDADVFHSIWRWVPASESQRVKE